MILTTHTLLNLTRGVFLLWVLGPSVVVAQDRIDWARFTAEKEVVFQTPAGEYAGAGKFDGVGLLYFRPELNRIEFTGFNSLEGVPLIGKNTNHKFFFLLESFTLTSIIPIGKGEYAFEPRTDGWFDRLVTGKIGIVVSPPGYSGTLATFVMEEHGRIGKGVMNRWVLPHSVEARAILKEFDKLFLGSNYVALSPNK